MQPPDMRSPAKAATKARANRKANFNNADADNATAEKADQQETALAAALREALLRKARAE